MARKKTDQLTADERRSLTQKAAHSERLAMITQEADKNLALKPNETWRSLLPEHKEAVIYRLYGGDTIKAICAELNISPGLIHCNAYLDEEFADKLRKARAAGTAAMVDRLLDIPFDDSLSDGSKKLLSDNIKWVASRHNRKDYGEHVQVDTNIQSHVVVPNWMGLPPVIDAEQLPPSDQEDHQE